MIESFLPWMQIIKCHRVMFLQINHGCDSVMQILNMWEIRHDMGWANGIQTLETAFAKIYGIRLFLYCLTLYYYFLIKFIVWVLGSVGLTFLLYLYYASARAAIPKDYRPAGVKTRNLFSLKSGALKPKIKLLDGFFWGLSPVSSPCVFNDPPYVHLWLNFLF